MTASAYHSHSQCKKTSWQIIYRRKTSTYSTKSSADKLPEKKRTVPDLERAFTLLLISTLTNPAQNELAEHKKSPKVGQGSVYDLVHAKEFPERYEDEKFCRDICSGLEHQSTGKVYERQTNEKEESASYPALQFQSTSQL